MIRRPRTSLLLTVAAVPLALVASLLPGTGVATGSPTSPATRHPGSVPAMFGPAPATRGRALRPPQGNRAHRLVGLHTSLLPRHPSGQQVRFDLFDGRSVVGIFESKDRGPGFAVWSGRLEAPYGNFEVARSGSTYVISLTSMHGSYQVTRAAGGAYWITRPKAVHLSGDDAIAPPRPTANQGARTGPAPIVGGDSSTIDVLFVYTAAAAAELGGVNGVNAYVASIQAQSDQAYANSGIPLTMRAVGVVPTATVEAGGDLETDLARLQKPGDGSYDEVQGERDSYHADLVHLLISGDPYVSNICGLAYLGLLNQDTTAYGYGTSYVSQSACAINHTVTHETGHNLSADHDEYVNPGTQPGEAPYAHGFVNVNTGSISIMSYSAAVQAGPNPTACCSYPLLFSDPRTTYEGVVEGDPGTQDNARAITEYLQRAVDYRQSQIYPGRVSVTGKNRVGKTLTADPGGWLPSGLGFSYQWTLDGTPIAGATAKTLKLRAKYQGHAVAVFAAGSGPTYTAVGAASAPTTVRKGFFRHTTKPVLVGKHRVGHTLTVKIRHYRPKPTTVKVTWFRNGHRLKHTGRTYRLHKRDAGKRIYAKVVVKRPGYVSVHKKTAKVRIRR